MALEREPRPGAAPTSGPPEGARRNRGYRLSAPAWVGSQADAHLGQQRVDPPTPECSTNRTNRHRKSWLACALAHKACRDGFSVLHKRTSELFRELAGAHADGSIGRFLVRLSRIDILLLDDFAMAPLKDAERRDFLEICDDRYQRRSLILTSQMPIAHWHEQIGDPTIADSILDRLVHNAHRLELKGESMRKKLGRKPEPEEGQ